MDQFYFFNYVGFAQSVKIKDTRIETVRNLPRLKSI